MDLIRALLLTLEADAPEKAEELSSYSIEQKVYHWALAVEAGFVHGKVLEGDGVLMDAAVWRLTWAGHEFLDAARNEGTWKKVAEKVTKAGGAYTVPLLLELLKAEAKRHVWPLLGLPPV